MVDQRLPNISSPIKKGIFEHENRQRTQERGTCLNFAIIKKDLGNHYGGKEKMYKRKVGRFHLYNELSLLYGRERIALSTRRRGVLGPCLGERKGREEEKEGGMDQELAVFP